jgi:hypothetical protein
VLSRAAIDTRKRASRLPPGTSTGREKSTGSLGTNPAQSISV